VIDQGMIVGIILRRIFSPKLI